MLPFPLQLLVANLTYSNMCFSLARDPHAFGPLQTFTVGVAVEDFWTDYRSELYLGGVFRVRCFHGEFLLFRPKQVMTSSHTRGRARTKHALPCSSRTSLTTCHRGRPRGVFGLPDGVVAKKQMNGERQQVDFLGVPRSATIGHTHKCPCLGQLIRHLPGLLTAPSSPPYILQSASDEVCEGLALLCLAYCCRAGCKSVKSGLPSGLFHPAEGGSHLEDGRERWIAKKLVCRGLGDSSSLYTAAAYPFATSAVDTHTSVDSHFLHELPILSTNPTVGRPRCFFAKRTSSQIQIFLISARFRTVVPLSRSFQKPFRALLLSCKKLSMVSCED